MNINKINDVLNRFFDFIFISQTPACRWLYFQRLPDAGENLFHRWKSEPALLGDQLVADPDGELTPFALNEFCVDPQLFLDQCRRPGGIRLIGRSDLAIFDEYIFHNCLETNIFDTKPKTASSQKKIF